MSSPKTKWEDAGYKTIDEYLAMFNKEDEPKPEPQKGDECGYCEGDKQIFISWLDVDRERLIPCGACDGTGTIQDVEHYNWFRL